MKTDFRDTMNLIKFDLRQSRYLYPEKTQRSDSFWILRMLWICPKYIVDDTILALTSACVFVYIHIILGIPIVIDCQQQLKYNWESNWMRTVSQMKTFIRATCNQHNKQQQNNLQLIRKCSAERDCGHWTFWKQRKDRWKWCMILALSF